MHVRSKPYIRPALKYGAVQNKIERGSVGANTRVRGDNTRTCRHKYILYDSMKDIVTDAHTTEMLLDPVSGYPGLYLLLILSATLEPKAN